LLLPLLTSFIPPSRQPLFVHFYFPFISFLPYLLLPFLFFIFLNLFLHSSVLLSVFPSFIFFHVLLSFSFFTAFSFVVYFIELLRPFR
jgi:hypothetical protein